MAIENAEIAGTLIALSVPALKPVFGNLFNHLTEYTTSSRNQSRSLGGPSKPGTGLRSTVRDSKRLLTWSKHGNDDYEMMSSDNVSRGSRGVGREEDGGKRIRVTEEVAIIRAAHDV